MKQLFIFTAAVIALFGCNDESACDPVPGPNPNDDQIKITTLLADVKPSARTAIDTSGKASWINGDALGLYCTQSKTPATNVSFTLSGLPDAPVWTPSSNIYWADATTQHTFLAYAPYASGNSSSGSVKLPALNSQTGTITPAQDFLISNNYGSSGLNRPANGIVPLIFKHTFALIQLQITINSSIASGTTLKTCTLSGGASDKLFTSDGNSTIDLSTGTITTAGTTTNTLVVTPSSAPTLSATKTNFFIIILPGTYALTLQVALTEGVATITVPAANITSTAFNGGSKYIYTMAISRTAITISNPTITDWNPVTSGSINGGI